jgi:hypothetical protein
MPLEPSVTYISDLNPLWPTPGDPKSAGDDHIRNHKAATVNTWPLVKGPVPIAHDQFASKDYVNQTAFNTVLPAQPGGTTNYALVSNGGAASWKVADIYSDTTRLAQATALALCF